MPTSEARVIANRLNAARSTGPRTPEGKAQSRTNALKHGMTGQGVVVPDSIAPAVEARHQALRTELAPVSAMGAILVQQMATLSVRMEQGARQEFAAIDSRVRSAEDDFDEARVDRAEALLDGLHENPKGNLRRLRKSPEGVDLMVQNWRELRDDLNREGKPLWTASHLVRAANLLGIREEDARGSRIGVLSRGVWGDFEALAHSEGGALSEDARKAWARGQLTERIDREIADLEDHFETLDFEMIEQDRAGAGARALFDPSPAASLARRYESEARRGFFHALKELRRVELEAAERPAPARPLEIPAPLASFRAEAPPRPTPSPAPPVAPSRDPLRPLSRVNPSEAEVVRGRDGQPLAIGLAEKRLA